MAAAAGIAARETHCKPPQHTSAVSPSNAASSSSFQAWAKAASRAFSALARSCSFCRSRRSRSQFACRAAAAQRKSCCSLLQLLLLPPCARMFA